ncbi:hypothetical protein [Patulibacter sp.]|uniref:hypothetical protein n=1 Tax=Patulibacter sp. TaxID=1912859 RepID=UPI00271E038B|nr:hypothetical protein [Patulibacter sp.]MDO9407308.1 hypothetical protein [Patulibacter sp.]
MEDAGPHPDEGPADLQGGPPESADQYDAYDPAMLRETWDPAAAPGVEDPLAGLYTDPEAAAERRARSRSRFEPEVPRAEPPGRRPTRDGVVLSVPRWLLLLVYVPAIAAIVYGFVAAGVLDDASSSEGIGGLIAAAILPVALSVLVLQVVRHRVVIDGRWLHVRISLGWRTPVDLQRLQGAEIVRIKHSHGVEFRDRDGRRVWIDPLHGDLEPLYRDLAVRWDGDELFLGGELARRIARYRT